MNKFVHTYQTGFIQGRYIGDNTRLIFYIMHFRE